MQIKVGDTVCYHTRIGGPVLSSGHEVTKIGEMCGTMCAWITNKRGAVDIEHLSLCKNKVE